MRTSRKKDFGSSAKRGRRRLRLALRLATISVAIVCAALAIVLTQSYGAYARLVDDRLARGDQTSRAGIYAAPRTLRAGQRFSAERLAEVLRRAGYIEGNSASEVWSGSFSATPQ